MKPIRSVALFFFLAFLLPWAIWGTTIAQQHGLIGWHIPQSLAFWLGLPIATYTAAAIAGGRGAVRDLLARLVRVRVAPVWYIVVLLTMPAIALAAAGVYTLGSAGTIPIGSEISARALLPAFLIETWLFLITEETAWRGFALPRLQDAYGPTSASLMLGLLWGLWHIPLFFIADSFQADLPFIGFVISAIATSVMATWMFNHTRGSVALAALFHASTDLAIGYLGVMSGSRSLFWLFVALQVIVAGALVYLRALSAASPIRRSLAFAR